MGMGRRAAGLITLFACTLALPREAAANERLEVVVPDGENLQYLSFWAARATGAFADVGLDVEVVSPSAPPQTATKLEESSAEAAVLPAPMALSMIARRVPIVLVAKLLDSDPIELVVRRSVLEDKKLDASMPLRARLEGIRGLRVGVAPHPPSRLRALFASEGLDADRDVSMVILHGKEQNAAFREGRVDALFAHTPFVERAIVHDDAVVLVNLSRREVPALAGRMVHALAFKKGVLATRRDLVVRTYRAIARTERAIHEDPARIAEALARAFPARDRREIDTIVALYEPAVPRSPEVHVEDLPPALALFPAGQDKPDLSGVHLADYVAAGVAREAETSTRGRAWAIVAVVGAIVLAAVVFFVVRARRSAHLASSQ